MKINFRLLLITFGIIVVISVSSTLVFFSLTTTILEAKLSNTLLKSSYDFVFNFQELVNKLEEDINRIDITYEAIDNLDIDTTSVDFIFPLTEDLHIDRNLMRLSSNVYLNFSSFSISNFLENNPNLLLRYIQKEDRLILFGKVFSEDLINEFSRKSRIGIVLITDGNPIVFSDAERNNQYFASLIKASKELNSKDNFTLYSEELNTGELYATVYAFDDLSFSNDKISFLLYSTSNEVFAFRETMGMIMLVLLFAGVALSLIFVMLFTTKLRKQISLLSKSAELASKGDFSQKVDIVSNDEIARLSYVFNQMLTELRQKEKREKEYSDFLTLLNQNPTITEISEETLKTIIHELGLKVGIFYLIENGSKILVSSYGLDKNNHLGLSDEESHQRVIIEQKPIELKYNEKPRKIVGASEEIVLKYSITIPIVYHNDIVAIIDIAGSNYPIIPATEYVNIIHDQLAVGIVNAKTYAQLQKYVVELKTLNEDYQNQNRKITEKNEQLVKLHTELRLKAEELEAEKSKAVELTKVKSNFLASVSHELRTPLNSIIGLTELAVNNEDTPLDTRKRLKVVLKSGKKLLGLINNILDYLKIEAGKIELKKESFVLSLFLKEIELFFEPLIKEKNLDFRINYKIDSDILIVSDKRKLEQIIINLIGNAIKFTNNGNIILTVQLLAEKELKISIKDTGVGIKKENLDLIFEEFTQGSAGTKRKYEGTGLGLAISREFAHLLGGEIFVESEYGKGSEFFLLFRDMPIERIDTFEKISFHEIQSIKKDNGNTILFLSDYEKTKKIVVDYLTINKFNVISYERLPEDYNEFKSNLPLAVIIDVDLLQSDVGYLAELKISEVMSSVPIILIGMDEKNKWGYGLKVQDFFLAPLTSEKTYSIINSHNGGVKRVIIITDLPEEYKTFLGNDDSDIIFKIANSDIDILSLFAEEKYDIVLIDIVQNLDLSLEMVNNIKTHHNSKHIPIYFGIKDFAPDESIVWVNKFYEQMRKMKQHPMDMLKVIRDRLAIYFDDSGYLEKETFADSIVSGVKETKNELSAKILVVDDDQDTLFTIGELLSELGYNYITATNGVECLLKLSNSEPSLILLDIMMPQMDGFETLKRLKSDDDLKDIPVIALTAYAMLENREIIDKHGFTDLITKPVSLELMSEKIQKYINKIK